MAYCKHCGMYGQDSSACEWCGRELPPVVRIQQSAAAQAAAPTAVAQETPFVEYIEQTLQFPAPKQDDIIAPPVHRSAPEPAESLRDFGIYVIALILMGSALIAWHYSNPFVFGTIAIMFAAGFVLARYQIVPAFEEVWDEIGLPLMLMLVVLIPVLLVYLGFIAYGLIKRNTDRTVVALLSPHFAVLMILMAISMLTDPNSVPMKFYGQFRGMEFLSLCAVLLGWSALSWRRLIDQLT